MSDPIELMYGKQSGIGLHIRPDRRNSHILLLLKFFDVGKNPVSDEKIKSVVLSVCQTCPALAICVPQFIGSGLPYSPTIDGSQTHTDACALGRYGGAFIPDRNFR